MSVLPLLNVVRTMVFLGKRPRRVVWMGPYERDRGGFPLFNTRLGTLLGARTVWDDLGTFTCAVFNGFRNVK